MDHWMCRGSWWWEEQWWPCLFLFPPPTSDDRTGAMVWSCGLETPECGISQLREGQLEPERTETSGWLSAGPEPQQRGRKRGFVFLTLSTPGLDHGRTHFRIQFGKRTQVSISQTIFRGRGKLQKLTWVYQEIVHCDHTNLGNSDVVSLFASCSVNSYVKDPKKSWSTWMA